MEKLFWVTLSVTIVLVLHTQSSWGLDNLNSEEDAFLKEVQEAKLSKEDVKELLPLILDGSSQTWPVAPSSEHHHRSKRFIFKKKLLLKKLLILSKLGLLGNLGNLGNLKKPKMESGYGYESPKPSYGPPPKYGPPPAPQYGPPPAPSYGAPSSGYGGDH